MVLLSPPFGLSVTPVVKIFSSFSYQFPFFQSPLYSLWSFYIYTFIRIPFYPAEACGYVDLLGSIYCWLYCFSLLLSFLSSSAVNKGKRLPLSCVCNQTQWQVAKRKECWFTFWSYFNKNKDFNFCYSLLIGSPDLNVFCSFVLCVFGVFKLKVINFQVHKLILELTWLVNSCCSCRELWNYVPKMLTIFLLMCIWSKKGVIDSNPKLFFGDAE